MAKTDDVLAEIGSLIDSLATRQLHALLRTLRDDGFSEHDLVDLEPSILAGYIGWRQDVLARLWAELDAPTIH